MRDKHWNITKHDSFLKSAFNTEGSFIQSKPLIKWLKDQNQKASAKVNKTLFSRLKHWEFNDPEGTLKHKTGRFFSICGVQIHTNWGRLSSWEQPIINQPEIGFLGFIVKEFDGIFHFLMQAKIEPGNLNNIQLSPTLQATKSNYTLVHKGKEPHYLKHFLSASPNQILFDQLQSEQGARFLKKRNRNIIIKVEEEIEVNSNFVWLTLGQIKHLMHIDNLVNMDCRTVLSGISYAAEDTTLVNRLIDQQHNDYQNSPGAAFLKSALTGSSLHSLDEIISMITQFKSKYFLEVKKVPLKSIKDWVIEDDGIYHINKKHFRVIPVEVEIENREVVSWHQPMIQPVQSGICAFVCREIDGVIHFAVNAKVEGGNHDIMELAPTVQCLLNDEQAEDTKAPFLDYVLSAPKKRIVFDTFQSEEGGRFYHEQNRNMLIIAGEELPIKLPEGYYWLTLNQLLYLLKFNNYINIQARSLIAAVSFI